MAFHVTDVKKPLAAVCKIADKGNIVCFGPRACDNYIKNIETGEVTKMTREKGQYVIEFEYEEIKPQNSERVFPRQE